MTRFKLCTCKTKVRNGFRGQTLLLKQVLFGNELYKRRLCPNVTSVNMNVESLNSFHDLCCALKNRVLNFQIYIITGSREIVKKVSRFLDNCKTYGMFAGYNTFNHSGIQITLSCRASTYKDTARSVCTWRTLTEAAISSLLFIFMPFGFVFGWYVLHFS